MPSIKRLEKGTLPLPGLRRRGQGRRGQGGRPGDDPGGVDLGSSGGGHATRPPVEEPSEHEIRAENRPVRRLGPCARTGPWAESGMETTDLPDDLALCHEIIRQQADTIRESQRRIEQLEHQVELLLRRQYGPRRESVDPDQLRLFTDDAPDDVAEAATEEPPEPEDAKPKRTWRRRGRQRLPEGLPRKRVEYELSAEELPCPDCGHTRTKIGEEVSEQLEYVPSSLFVIVNTRDSATPAAPARSTSPSRTSRRSRSTRGCPARGSWPRRSRASIATTSRSTGSKTSSPATGWSCRGPRSAAGWPPAPSCSRRSTT